MSAFAGPLIGGGLSLAGSLLGGDERSIPFNRRFARDRIAGGQSLRTQGGLLEGVDFNNFFSGLSTLPGLESSFGLTQDDLLSINPQGRGGERVRFPVGGQEFQRILALGEVPQLESTFQNEIIPFADQFAGGILGNREAGFESVLNSLGVDIGNVEGLLDQSVGSLSNLDSTRAALQSQRDALGARTQDIVRNASRAAGLEASSRGLGTSTVPLAQVTRNVLPEVVDSQLQAEASLDSSLADIDRSFQLARSNALANQASTLGSLAGLRANIGSQFAQDRTGEFLLSQLLGVRQQAPLARFNTLAQPSVIFGRPNTSAENTGGIGPIQTQSGAQRLGGGLSSLGGLLLGGSLFGPNGFFAQG